MYIRRTKTNNSSTGESYFTYRLVRSERTNGRVRQITLLNLGRHFDIKQDDWPILCQRIEQLLSPQSTLFELECADRIEKKARYCVGKLINNNKTSTLQTTSDNTETPSAITPPSTPEKNNNQEEMREIAVDSLELTRPRSVGVEHVALDALVQLGIVDHLSELGIPRVQCSAIIGNIIARMAAPASEWATWRWLKESTALGELLDVDFESLSHMTLYRGSDILMKNRQRIEEHLFNRIQDLFGLEHTITLYDLTNTYFEGSGSQADNAQYGRSKEKRSDCPLVTLGLVLDHSGFVMRSEIFAGNIAEGQTLEQMLRGLGATPGALVVMDAGIATQKNIAWLKAHHYRYVLVKRGGQRCFYAHKATTIEAANGDTIRLYKDIDDASGDTLLRCHSESRERKERAMLDTMITRFEDELKKIKEGLTRPRTQKNLAKLQQRVGRIRQKYARASRYYEVRLISHDNNKVTDIEWTKRAIEGSLDTDPGVYCLRTTEHDWSEEKLWRTYSMLTDLENVFRSLKSELGLRPIFHRTDDRIQGHLFITVLAYQCVQSIRYRLKQAGINDSWSQLRQVMSMQHRVTVSMDTKQKRRVHVRKATTPESGLSKIYRVLKLTMKPGGTKKLVC